MNPFHPTAVIHPMGNHCDLGSVVTISKSHARHCVHVDVRGADRLHLAEGSTANHSVACSPIASVRPSEAEPDEPRHRIEVAIHPLEGHYDEKPEGGQRKSVATPCGEPVAAQQSPDEDREIEKETGEAECRPGVAEVAFSTHIRRTTQTAGRQA